MLLLIASFLLFIVLLFRIGKAASARERFFFYFLVVLYALPILLILLNAEPPQWFQLTAFSIVISGLLFFSVDFLGLWFKKNREAARRLKDLRKQKGPLYEIIEATRLLSESCLGALIILERRVNLELWCKKGVLVDARLSRELLFSIFSPPGALHDGATIVRRDRVQASGVILPLSKNPYLSKELGTRHRAAIGMSEVSDALCLVISEETGSISLADRGYLYYDLPAQRLAEYLERGLRFKLSRKKFKAPGFEAAQREPLRVG